MWLILAFISAALLGFYDTFKKKALLNNAVIPVLFSNTFVCSVIFLPFVVLSYHNIIDSDTTYYVRSVQWNTHKYIIIKACIVLTSWLLGYFGIKHLPLTIVGPINATRPIMVLVGAMLVFGERLNAFQSVGVILSIISFFLLSQTGKKEGIDFKHDKWIYAIVGAAILGAISGMYDKYLMAPVSNGGLGLDAMMVQAWYNIYQCGMMGIIMILLWWPNRKRTTPFCWSWSIVLVSLFLSAADFAYFYALSLDNSMLSIVSMIRRGSVLVSFFFGAIMFHEKNLSSKFIDLLLVFIGMVFLYLGSQ